MTVRQYAVLRSLLFGFHEEGLLGEKAYRVSWHFFRGFAHDRKTTFEAFKLEACELERATVGDLLEPGSQNEE